MAGGPRATSCMNAIDTNILAYSIDASDPAKADAALALIERLSTIDTVLLWQVACELGAVVTKVRRRGGTTLTPEEVVATFRAKYALAFPDEWVLETAFELHDRHSLSYWDALLLAACVSAGVDALYTEDLTTGATIA